VFGGPKEHFMAPSALMESVRVLTNDADLNSSDLKVRGSDSYTDGGRK